MMSFKWGVYMTPTKFDEIYEIFISKIEDDNIRDYFINNYEFAQSILYDFLRSSISKFTYSKKDLHNRDEVLAQFNIELDDLEKEILATLMIIEYLSPKILRTELLEDRLGSKDFRQFAPQNLLKEVKSLRESFKSEANLLIMEYYYRY